jgi:hypothetical protein
MKITLHRESENIFIATSDLSYWSDGAAINARLAFDKSGLLSSARAQALDAATGNRYILVAPFGIKNPALLSLARKLNVGQSAST